jgi:hypothetical protein
MVTRLLKESSGMVPAALLGGGTLLWPPGYIGSNENNCTTAVKPV